MSESRIPATEPCYAHRYLETGCDLPVGKVVCVGRNYAEHARELNNPVPAEPILFIKPASSLVSLEGEWAIPQGLGEVHHETEVALLIGQRLQRASAEQARAAVVGYGLALDLTLRDLQSQLKQKGHPWERAKAFDGGCPLSSFVPAEQVANPEQLTFSLNVNGLLRQQGDVRDMMMPLFELVAHISQWFTLNPGDVVLTGTPAGVAALASGDELVLELDGYARFAARVANHDAG